MDLAERVAIDWTQHVALTSFHNVHHDTPDRDTYLQTLLSQHSPLPDGAVHSYYPTAEKQRQKLRLKQLKAEGKAPTKRAVHVEPHFDDCGKDLSGIANNY